MDSLEKSFRSLGQKRDIKELQNLRQNTSEQQLLEFVNNCMSNKNFVTYWNYLLQSFNNSHDAHYKRFAVVNKVLRDLGTKNVSSNQYDSILTSLLLELKKFQIDHLIHFSKFCLEMIQKGNISNTVWKELFPEILNILLLVESLKSDGEEVSGLEYKENVVKTLYGMEWSSNIIIQLAIMFIDMPLSKDEHLLIVKKLSQSIDKVTYQEIPVFIYQLLRLCSNQDGKYIFLGLQEYFSTRIYNNNFLENNSETTDLIVDSSTVDILQCESTVLYHIYKAATMEQNSIAEYFSSLKNLTKTPECILHSFQLTVLLTISTVHNYKDKTFELIKMAISRSLAEDLKQKESIWLREMVPTSTKITNVFKHIIHYSAEERDLVLQGLVSLSFVLLATGSALGRDSVAEAQWALGTTILVRLLRQKKHMAGAILRTLTTAIMTTGTGANGTGQYIDCLRVLCKRYTLAMLDKQVCVVDLMETVMEVPEPVANRLMEAVMPLTKASHSVRDHLIVLLRKSLYSRVTEKRQISVNGFLKLLKHLKISNLAALSQCSNSSSSSMSNSLLTQITMTKSGHGSSASVFSNEALCWEVLGILRRCFFQQAEVKGQLYDGLYDTICTNPELGCPILEFLLSHFNDFYISDGDILPPVNFSKITKLQETDAILLEPLGKFIYAISLIVNKVRNNEDQHEDIGKFTEILDSMCERMPKCELVHFELDDGTDLTDVLPESQQKVHVLKEAMLIYEALMGYKICSWSPESNDHANIIYSLYQGYSRLLKFSKELAKPKKARKKDKDETASQVTDITNRDGNKLKAMKLPDSILDLQAAGKILNLLHRTSVDWTTNTQANILKSKIDFHQYFMQLVINLVQSIKKNKDTESKRMKMYYSYSTEIAATLFERCIVRYEEFADFDQRTAILSLECFYLILQNMCTMYKDDLPGFFHVVGGKSKDVDIDQHLEIFFDVYKRLFSSEDGDTYDAEVNKMLLIVVNTLSLLCDQLPMKSTSISIKFLDWMKQFVSENTVKYKQVATAFITLLFNVQIRFKSDTTIFKNMSLRLGDLYGTISENNDAVEDIKFINEVSGDSVLLGILNSIRILLNDVDWIITRIKSEYFMITYSGETDGTKRECLTTKERGLCCQLCLIIEIMNNVANLKIQPGTLSDGIMKNLAHLYNTLCTITKHFYNRSIKSSPSSAFQNARFDMVVKKAGKTLSPTVYQLITHIDKFSEEDNNDGNSGTEKKKKSRELQKSKVLKDTRQIPKIIYEMEQFSKSVTQLSTKSKQDLARYIGQGTTRDFRIRIDGLKEAFGNDKGTDDSVTSTQNSTANESTISEDIQPTDQEISDEAESPPPKKKPRKRN